MKITGLALGGGGSRGAFQIGAWQAFRELDIHFDVIAGTSIGSINGAFMACDDYEGALAMWQNMQIGQFVALPENQPLKSADLLSLKNANVLAREFLTQHHLDTSPFRSLLAQYIQEEKVRQSPIRYGLLTALLPSLSPQPRWIDEIPANQLLDYIMASSGLPGLLKVKIDGRRFIDGGLVENVPISMLRDEGIRQIVAVDIGQHATLHSHQLDNVQLTYIHDRQELGSIFDITPAVLEHNRRLGYLDTLKAFGRLNGEYYTFEQPEYRQLLHRYGPENLSGLEQAAIAFEVDRCPVYPADQFIGLLRQRRREVQQIYEAQRHLLQIDDKSRALMSGRLKVLKLLPPMRLAFLMELRAGARQNGSLLKIPRHLFRNLDLAAQALSLLDDQPG